MTTSTRLLTKLSSAGLMLALAAPTLAFAQPHAGSARAVSTPMTQTRVVSTRATPTRGAPTATRAPVVHLSVAALTATRVRSAPVPRPAPVVITRAATSTRAAPGVGTRAASDGSCHHAQPPTRASGGLRLTP